MRLRVKSEGDVNPFTGHSQRRALLVIGLLPISGQMVNLAFDRLKGVFVVGY
jgi:hypothetical protein